MSKPDKNEELKKLNFSQNPWLVQCCWSCCLSDISYNLDGIVCRRLHRDVSYNNVCGRYIANSKNPYLDEMTPAY